MYGIDTHPPLGMKGLTNMKHIYLKLSQNKYCVCCVQKFKFACEWTWQNALVYCMDEEGFEHAVTDNEHGFGNTVKICKCL
jgi:hypothetical protein